MVSQAVADGTVFSGWMVFGDVMYKVGYRADADRKLVPGTLVKQRVGAGWSGFSTIETSRYYDATAAYRRTNQYALRSDGVLFRWTMSGDTWTKPVSATGFSSLRTMALISQTRTYDTFLATTRGCALYTVRLPVTAPLKPVVKLVRAAGSWWEPYQNLIAEKCGQYGTLLLAIDRNGQHAQMFAIGHANGTATVIQEFHWVQAEFPDPVYFRWTVPPAPGSNLNGE
ncbi:hypothetical protein [Kribbella sp. NPDC050470]|uniref:hypothetical protein n=1 Tax=unclassified Kribbella TaxID=2644121 RepID=UPI00379F601F